MTRRVAIVVGFVAAVGIAVAAGCTDVSGSSTSVLSIQFDTLGAPSVVVGDTLRDTTGAVIRPVVHAFNFKGEEILPAPVFFLSPDSGLTVDSVTGIVVGDSLRSTPARIVATVGRLQAVQRLNLTLLQKTQELRLQVQRQVANLINEKRASGSRANNTS